MFQHRNDIYLKNDGKREFQHLLVVSVSTFSSIRCHFSLKSIKWTLTETFFPRTRFLHRCYQQRAEELITPPYYLSNGIQNDRKGNKTRVIVSQLRSASPKTGFQEIVFPLLWTRQSGCPVWYTPSWELAVMPDIRWLNMEGILMWCFGIVGFSRRLRQVGWDVPRKKLFSTK